MEHEESTFVFSSDIVFQFIYNIICYDFWSRRRLHQQCTIDAEARGHGSTEMTISAHYTWGPRGYSTPCPYTNCVHVYGIYYIVYSELRDSRVTHGVLQKIQ